MADERGWIGRILCALRLHAWHQFLPSWGLFRICGRCDRIERFTNRALWVQTTAADMRSPHG